MTQEQIIADYKKTRHIILAEIFVEEGKKYGDRFYELQIKKKGQKGFEPFENGYVVTKRW